MPDKERPERDYDDAECNVMAAVAPWRRSPATSERAKIGPGRRKVVWKLLRLRPGLNMAGNQAKGQRAMVADQKTTIARAWFVYEGARLAALAAQAPVIPAHWADREEPFRQQFLKVIEKQCGPDRCGDPEALHEEWVIAYATMGWTFGEVYDPAAKTHPDMVPYDQLGQLEQDKDSVFVALCEIARQWIREPGQGEADA